MPNKPAVNHVYIEGQNFLYGHRSLYPRRKIDFKLHTHDGYEIYIFIEGNAEYVIESKIYPMKPYDILITKNDELHQVKHLSFRKFYERTVIEVNDEFFEENNCMEYLPILKVRNNDSDNIISPNYDGRIKLIECMERIEGYMKESEGKGEAIARAGIIELLHVINNLKSKTVQVKRNKNISKIIEYIDKNLTSEIKLEDIADSMFMSKYHICRIFKEHTGITIYKYITNKRIQLVQKMYANGMTLSTSSLNAGFSSYSSFYKSYMRETGKSPRNDIENYNLFKDMTFKE